MDTNDKTKCECYCHKKGAHCCDGGSGSCALCGEISDWAIKELVPPPVTASLETGGWEEEFDVKNKEHWGIGSVGAFDIKDFIRKTITHTTEQTARETREEVLREIIAVAEPYDGAKWLNNLSPKQLEKIILSEPLEKE